MSRGILVESGFGWVVDEYQQTYPGKLESALTLPARQDLYEWLEETAKEEQLDVLPISFGDAGDAVALIARDSFAKSYGWFHDGDRHMPNRLIEPACERELAKTLDVLGWQTAELGDPTWLILVSYQ